MLRRLDNSAAGNGRGDITTTVPKRTTEEQMTKSQLTATLATQRGLPLYKAEVVSERETFFYNNIVYLFTFWQLKFILSPVTMADPASVIA